MGAIMALFSQDDKFFQVDYIWEIEYNNDETN